ncbi:hypothetical protein Bra471DRAFT_01822 [Bradyrhizobium sp. WSM471]|nr:hypothetical protein Bra471DRAFT_01822 [Bradyrhizobium sp. WSM471]
MRKSDVTCSECGAGFLRLELASERGTEGRYYCPACGNLVEAFGAAHLVVYRFDTAIN